MILVQGGHLEVVGPGHLLPPQVGVPVVRGLEAAQGGAVQGPPVTCAARESQSFLKLNHLSFEAVVVMVYFVVEQSGRQSWQK